jgi:hypothetical protein
MAWLVNVGECLELGCVERDDESGFGLDNDHADRVSLACRPVENALAATIDQLLERVVIEPHGGEFFVVDFVGICCVGTHMAPVSVPFSRLA